MDGKVRPEQNKNFTTECWRGQTILVCFDATKRIVNDENLTKRIVHDEKLEKTITPINGDKPYKIKVFGRIKCGETIKKDPR